MIQKSTVSMMELQVRAWMCSFALEVLWEVMNYLLPALNKKSFLERFALSCVYNLVVLPVEFPAFYGMIAVFHRLSPYKSPHEENAFRKVCALCAVSGMYSICLPPLKRYLSARNLWTTLNFR